MHFISGFQDTTVVFMFYYNVYNVLEVVMVVHEHIGPCATTFFTCVNVMIVKVFNYCFIFLLEP